MTPDRGPIEDLWCRFLAGEALSRDEERRILEAMSADADLRADLLEDERIDGALAATARSTGDADAFTRAFLDRAAAERDGTRFIDKVRREIREEKAGRRGLFRRLRWGRAGRPSWGPALAAAGAVAALALLGILALVRTPRPVGGPHADVPPEIAAPPPPEAPPVDSRKPPPEKTERSPEPSPDPRIPPPPPLPGKTGTPPAPPPEKPPAAIPVPRPAPPPTRAAVAELERIDGEVWAILDAGRSAAKAGQGLAAGQGVEASSGGAAVKYPDETRIGLHSGTAIYLEGPAGKSVRLPRGAIDAQVPRQPAGQPMTFVTPHSEATVLGTRLSLAVTEDATRLEVAEGRVRLRRLPDGKSVDVAAGQFALAAAGTDLAAKPVPIDDILLLPRQGRIAGSEWRISGDDKAVSGQALEAARPKTIVVGKAEIRNRLSEYVEFSFTAEAGRDYWIWVRGCCTAPADRRRYDAVALEAFNARFARPSPWPEIASVGAYPFNGYGHREGYLWTGGDIDEPPAGTGPQASIAIRFLRSGKQVLRLHALEAPMRVDAIWLSTTQKTPPEPDRKGPGR